MTKMFAQLVGWVLVVVGVLNFFIAPIKLLPAHGVFHIAAGLLGIWAVKNHSVGYAMWVGIVGVVLAAIGFFFGYPTLLGIINLPVWITWIHLVLGVWGLWTYWAATKKGGAMSAPSGTM